MVVNMRMKSGLICLLCGVCLQMAAQSYPTDYGLPVKPPMRLSGTFGELRPSHFHMGIDVKSKTGTIGDPLLAVQDGFISRIKIQAGGYGQALYIDHPDGWTSLYAHLDSYMPEVSEYIEKMQYEEQQFELDVALPSHLFPVKKGQQIGIMGVTGWSFGPHLHFELRRTATEVAHNPLHFGYEITDTRAPVPQKIISYQLDHLGRMRHVNGWRLRKSGSAYSPSPDTILLGHSRNGIGLVVYDPMDLIPNRNDIYQLDAFLDDQMLYSISFDSIPYEHSWRMFSHADYGWYSTYGERVHRCYRTSANEHTLYPHELLDGIIKLYQKEPAKLRLEVRDFNGNTAKVETWVKRVRDELPTGTYDYIVPWSKRHIIRHPGVTLEFPEKSFAEDCFLSVTANEPKQGKYEEAINVKSSNDKPLNYYEARFPLPKADTALAAPWTVLWLAGNGTPRQAGGEIRRDSLIVSLNRFGTFIVTQDTFAPTIRPRILKKVHRRYQPIEFEIYDNWASIGKARELRYRATMNGEWVLFKYDLKRRRIRFDFPTWMEPGNYLLELSVWDDRDNQTNYKYQFQLQ